MATITNRYRFSVDFRRKGDLPKPRLKGALREAQLENGRLWLQATRRLAQTRTKGAYRFPPRRRRGPKMVALYRSDVSDGGRTLALTNPTLRAKLFEEGAKPHVIRASAGSAVNVRGRIISGAPLLRFKTAPGGAWVSRREVRHPGQKPQYPVRDARASVEGQFERNIADAIRKAIDGGL